MNYLNLFVNFLRKKKGVLKKIVAFSIYNFFLPFYCINAIGKVKNHFFCSSVDR